MIIFECDKCGKQARSLEGWTMFTGLGIMAHFDTIECRDAFEDALEIKQHDTAGATSQPDNQASGQEGGTS